MQVLLPVDSICARNVRNSFVRQPDKMSSAKYSLEEIELKRLKALQLKQRSQQKAVGDQNNGNTPNERGIGGGGGGGGGGGYFSVLKNVKQSGNKLVDRPQAHSSRYSPFKTKSQVAFYGTNKNRTTGKCYMISENRFAVETASFDQKVIELFKTIPSKMYDSRTKIWDFHLDHYENLMSKLLNLKAEVTITALPPLVLQTFRRNLGKKEDPSSVDLSPIDPKLIESLMPFQREGVCYGISKSGRCFIADDMGLGKTIQALGIAHYYKNDWPLLIVSPSSVRYQWSEAIYNFLPSVPMQHVQHFTSAKDILDNPKIVIVSYDVMVRAINVFERHIFGVIILDESHFLKSFKTARTKAATRLTIQARRVILLSGTPALSRPEELYSQISMIVPKFMGVQEFGIRYCAGQKKHFGWDFSGSSNMQELQLLLKACCLIRRLKSEVLKQLPAKLREVVLLDPGLIQAGTKEMRDMSENLNGTALRGVERHNALLQYYSETSRSKLKAICNYVTDLLESGRKFLVFAHHRAVLDKISEVVESKKIRYIRIDGGTSSQDRKARCDLFQENENCLVAVLSITAANAGITLTAAQLVVFAELFWNPGILCQAEDRVHRIGQVDSVVIQYLVAKGTADDHLWPLIQAKLNVLGKAGLNQNFSLNKSDVTVQEQAMVGQTTLDAYCSKPDDSVSYSTRDRNAQTKLETFITKASEANAEVAGSVVGENVHREMDDFKDLLDLDDDDFNAIDLNDMV